MCGNVNSHTKPNEPVRMWIWEACFSTTMPHSPFGWPFFLLDFFTCQQILPTQCCLWPINSAWLSLKFWTTCFSGAFNMSQVEKEAVDSPSAVLSLGSGFRASLEPWPHQSALERAVSITTRHCPPQSQQERGEALRNWLRAAWPR